MNLNEFQEQTKRTMRKDLTNEELLVNGALGLCGESGEVADIIKKWRYQGHKLDIDKIIEECGDCLYYCATVATSIGKTLEEIAKHNVEKLELRYPDGFDEKRSIHREK